MRRTDDEGKTYYGRLALALVATYVEPVSGFRDNQTVKKRTTWTVLRFDLWEGGADAVDEIFRERVGYPTYEALERHIQKIGLPVPDRREIEDRAFGYDPDAQLIANLRSAQGLLLHRYGPDHPHFVAFDKVLKQLTRKDATGMNTDSENGS